MNQSKIYSQKFSQWWIFIGLFFSTLIFGYVYYSAIQKKEDLFWIIYLSIIALVVILVLLLFLLAKLQIRLLPNSINYRFIPFHLKWKVIPLASIENLSLIKYDALGEFGGWGIRKGRNGEKALIVQGDQAVKLELKSKKIIILGVKDHEMAASILATI